MPDPKTCAAKGLTPGTKEYNDCVNYTGAYANEGKAAGNKSVSPVKGRLKKSSGGGGY
jgi:hypothetical protein